MDRKELRLKCVEMTNRTAAELGLEFAGGTKEVYLARAEDIFKYVSEKNTELRLKCADAALKTVTKRGFRSPLLFKKMEQIETFVLEEKAKDPEEAKPEPPKEESVEEAEKKPKRGRKSSKEDE